MEVAPFKLTEEMVEVRARERVRERKSEIEREILFT
jgi:hypothetical protein